MANGTLHCCVAAVLSLLAGCHQAADQPASGPADPSAHAETIVDVNFLQAPWQRPGSWVAVEAIRGGRLDSILAARDAGGLRFADASRAGYTIREATADCRARTIRLGTAHGHLFGSADRRPADPVGAVVTPAGIATLCRAPAKSSPTSPEAALLARLRHDGQIVPGSRREGDHAASAATTIR